MANEFVVYSKTKAEFEALVSSGEVDTSQMGIIAETGEMWWNGEYRPIAETVPFAKDLTGRIEATPEEFTFRPSAGDKSIRDESALIKKIKGNTSVWGQLAEWTGIADKGQNTLATYEISDKSLDIAYSKAGVPPTVYIFSSPLYPAVTGHKYLCTIDIKTSKSLGLILYPWGDVFLRFTSNQSWTTHSAFYTPTRTEFTNRFILRFQAVANQTMEVGDSIHCRNLQFFDLTKMFGAGNEPTTVEEFKALFPNDYYDYNTGELVSMTSNGLFANGFNQFNGEYAEVLPNYTYYLGGAYTTIGFTEEIGGTLEDITIPTDKLYTPTKKGYIYATGTNININFSHTGVRNGEYEPYWGATKDLSIIQKYFPNGMRSAGSIYDEISFDETIQQWVAIQRVDSVDLGSLSWAELTTTQENVYRFYSTELQKKIKKTTSTFDVANLLCIKYDTISAHYTYNANKGVSLNQNGTIIIFEPSITSEGGASSFKTAMSGVMLYYELAEPIITPIEEPVGLSYKVGDFGVEKMLSDSFSAPFKADIVYHFNATDRVRENSMNISRLSKEYALLNSKALTTDEQTLTADQKAQVATNLGGNVTNGLARYVGGKLPLKKISAPDANGAEQTYVLPNASDEDKASANGVIATESFVDDGYVPRPSGTSTDKANKVLVYSDNRTYDSGVGIAQDVSDITEGATDSIPKSGHVKQYVESLVGERLSMHDSKIVVVVEDTYFDVNNAQKVALSTATKEILAKAKTLSDNITIRQQDKFAVVKAIKLSDGVIDVGSIAYALPTASDDILAAADEVLSTKSYVVEYMNANLPTAVATATERITTWPTTNSIRANTIYDISLGTTTALTIDSFVGGSGTTYAFDDVWRVRFAGLSSALSVIPTVRWENGVAPNYTEWAICDLEFRRLPNGEYIGKWTIYK